ncbi:MAG: sulfotransferase [Pseudomonadota bacterium]
MLRTALRRHRGIRCESEVFNPDFLDDAPYDDSLGAAEILDRFIFADDGTDRARGFLLHRGGARFGDWPELWEQLAGDRKLRIILLHRHDLLRRFLSHQRMRLTNRGLTIRPFVLSAAALRADFRIREDELALARRRFAAHECLQVSYEDLCMRQDGTLRRIQAFLGVRSVRLEPRTSRNPVASLEAQIANLPALRQAFQGTRWAWFFRSERVPVAAAVGTRPDETQAPPRKE